ncbi:hypothetical protein ACFFX0_02895 [Citricoccus parietis]|uniref:Uncharacterized protein n=1 Tax=Citricoccus parietis TaxID=592307 RepID=A0ABV5FU55_9MICC
MTRSRSSAPATSWRSMATREPSPSWGRSSPTAGPRPGRSGGRLPVAWGT